MIKIICNGCGADITDGKAFAEIAVKLYKTPDFSTEQFKRLAGRDEHYCQKCAEKIVQFIHSPLSAVPETESPQEKKSAGKQDGTGKRIDYGKIAALRNAGWNNGKIADEMHMTKASVAQAVSKCRKGGMLNEAESGREVPDNEGAV